MTVTFSITLGKLVLSLFYKDGFDIKSPMDVDMPLNNDAKPRTELMECLVSICY